jgi:hypothetical protein
VKNERYSIISFASIEFVRFPIKARQAGSSKKLLLMIINCPRLGQGGAPNRLRSPAMARRHKLTASDFIGLGGAHNIADGKQRLRERDARAALDTRTPAQVLLGEPPPGRSALVKGQEGSQPRPKSTGTRVDLWRR